MKSFTESLVSSTIERITADFLFLLGLRVFSMVHNKKRKGNALGKIKTDYWKNIASIVVRPKMVMIVVKIRRNVANSDFNKDFHHD